MSSVVLHESYTEIGLLNDLEKSDHQRLGEQNNEFGRRVRVTFLMSTNRTDQPKYFLLENQFHDDLRVP
jgi:hypothetical protein